MAKTKISGIPFASPVSADGITLQESSGSISIKDGGVSAAKLATDAVETAKIKDGEVTQAKLATPPILTILAEDTLSGAATSITITGLDLDTDKMYILFFQLKEGATAVNTMKIYANSDENDGNYTSYRYYQQAAANGNQAGVGPQIIKSPSGNATVGWVQIYKDGDGKYVYLSNNRYNVSYYDNHCGSWATTGTNVTQIILKSDQANGIASGSWIRLAKVEAA